MQKNDQNLSAARELRESGGGDTYTVGDSMLERAKAVARQISERIRKVTEDTQLDHMPLATDCTEEQPPLR